MDWSFSTKNLNPDELLELARSKFLAATALLEHKGYEYEGEVYEGNENAVYLAGYALELILKRYIALKLGWSEYPPKHIGTGIQGYKEEKDDKSFIVHDLNRLFILSGLHQAIESDDDLNSYRITALKWQASMRYCPKNALSFESAEEILESIKYMIRYIIETI
jgi:hypothetical protein